MALAYLLCPTFQIENTAGKPATGGYLEVYIAGSRERYYCASDFNGTLHPFRIELDGLGSNIVLADDTQAYDVYVYNRYGALMMSRYGVKPGSGGGISGDAITSSDGSIIVTQTGDGVDLKVNAKPPTVMRCTAADLVSDGAFQFSELQRDGTSARVDSYTVKIDEGWWHFDAVARLRWSGEVNGTQSVSLYTANGSDSMTFDMSYPHSETVNISGELKAEQDGTSFVLGVLGVPVGMTVSLVDFGIHSIVGEGAGGKYNAGTGIVIDETNRVISIDPEVVQEKLTAGDNITIVNNVISATAEPQVNADWDATSGVAEILNKPVIPVVPPLKELVAGTGITITEGADDITISTNAEQQVNADWDATSGVAEILNKPVLATVATTGAYSDLSGKPTIPTATSDLTNDSGFITLSDVPAQVNADWDATSGAGEILNKPVLATVATTGAYSDLSGTPAIPTATSDLTNDSGFITLSDVPAQVNADWDATSGAAQILNKPVIPEGVPSYSSSDEGKVLGVVESGGFPTLEWVQSTGTVTDVEVNGSSVVNASGVAEVVVPAQVQPDWDATSGLGEILNKPSLATVATTGDYSDLSNTPAIPVIGTITV